MSAPRVLVCLYPDCPNTARTRGLCHGHYQTARAYVRDGKATEAALQARGLMAPKGTPSGYPITHREHLKTENDHAPRS